MRCKFCKRKPVIYNRIGFLCKEHFINYYLKTIQKTIEKYRLFGKEDRILVAVSGGKDSSALAYALHELGYEFEGLYIDLEIPEYSERCKEKAIELFNKIDKKLNIIKVSDFGVKIESIKRIPVCSVCGRVKRYLMNKFAYENGYDVLVTAHNLNDEAAFLLNNIYGKQFDLILKQIPSLEKEEKLVKKVKPLFFLTEKENLTYVLLKNVPFCNLECPYAFLGNRNTQIKWKKMIYSLDSQKSDFSYMLLKNLVSFIRKNYKQIEKGKRWIFCKVCGYPTESPDGVCSFCKIRKYFEERKQSQKQ